jgi:CBS domain-containing protein
MQVRELMTRDVAIVSAWDNLKAAARRMAELDVGVLPVGDEDRLVGVITDRDIVVRALAQGKDHTARVKEVMTPGVKYCFQDQEIDEISANMADIQVRRLLVLDRDKRLVGILSLGDIIGCGEAECALDALSGISRPAAEGVLLDGPRG